MSASAAQSARQRAFFSASAGASLLPARVATVRDDATERPHRVTRSSLATFSADVTPLRAASVPGGIPLVIAFAVVGFACWLGSVLSPWV